tara:strand:+ start:71302 stop:71778 length:477 start_codon:yes stop_codon:yes gene_type:complete
MPNGNPGYTTHRLKSGFGFIDIFDCVTNSQNGVCSIIGDFNTEFFFERHDQLNSVEGVSAKIIDKTRTLCDFLGIYAKMLYNNILYAFCSIAHVGILDPYTFCYALDNGMQPLNQVPAPNKWHKCPAITRACGLPGLSGSAVVVKRPQTALDAAHNTV